jgi:hypothetical protein
MRVALPGVDLARCFSSRISAIIVTDTPVVQETVFGNEHAEMSNEAG